MDPWTLLGTDLAVVVLLLSLAAVPSFRSKDPSYVDGCWGLAFVVVAVAAAVQTDGDTGRRALLVGLTTVWGLRLAGYLLARWRRQGPDPRYQRLLGPDPSPLRLWLKVFVLQAVLAVVVSLPVQLGQLYDGRLTLLNAVGVVLALTGIVTESLADRQLARFKADPANRGAVMDRGLWSWSRHPNYFGEALTWWGIGLVALHNGATALGLLGPVVITALLLTRSGIGPLERQLGQSKPGYRDYVARTSAFVPRPPKPTT